jgi:hypothetical protein
MNGNPESLSLGGQRTTLREDDEFKLKLRRRHSGDQMDHLTFRAAGTKRRRH